MLMIFHGWAALVSPCCPDAHDADADDDVARRLDCSFTASLSLMLVMLFGCHKHATQALKQMCGSATHRSMVAARLPRTKVHIAPRLEALGLRASRLSSA